MGDKSTIEWTDATWNPVTGCSKVSPGCAHCYAETLAKRLHGFGQSGYTDLPWTPANAAENVILHPDRLDQPLRWQKPRMVFVNSMSDLFHEEVPDEFILAVFTIMRRATQHTFQVLTKRAERMQQLVEHLAWRSPTTEERADESLPDWRRQGSQAYLEEPGSKPRPNIWLGVSIENRRYVHRADLLRETPAAARFISAEPLLGPLIGVEKKQQDYPIRPGRPHGVQQETWWPGLRLHGIDWLIVGGESGPQHRPIRPEWVRDLRDACNVEVCRATRETGPCHPCMGPAHRCGFKRTGARTAFFFKQWGGRTPKAGGRELDGRTWDEMPAVTA